jgi:dolichol-phosphate mannosyltransferase
MHDLSIIIPTYNEEENIGEMIDALENVLLTYKINGQILVVDDFSKDETIPIINEKKTKYANLELIVRKFDHGLSQSVVEGFTSADSDIFLVIDADFSHPPELIPQMYNLLQRGYDLVIGSRYMQGGGIDDWPLKRRFISKGATFLGKILFPGITDPVSGFFGINRHVVEKAPLTPRGYKILLEILGKGRWNNVVEVPFTFTDREVGSSKLKFTTILDYLHQVLDIGQYAFFHHESMAWPEEEKVLQFGLVGASGIVVNMVVLYGLTTYLGIFYLISSIFAIELSIISNFLLNDYWTFSKDKVHRLSNTWHRLGVFHLVSLGGLLINMGVLFILTEFLGIYYLVSNFIGILVAFSWNFIINRHTTWKI